jgi:uncharacterized membrane protein YcaP (DUF421 family)
MQIIWDALYSALGLASEPKDLTFSQVSLRSLIVFLAALIIMRLGDRRSLAQKSAFDLAFVVIVSSVLARAINGSGPFFATFGGLARHCAPASILAWSLYRSPALCALVKGKPVVLVRNGAYQSGAMRAQLVSENDFEEDMRLEAKTEEKADVKIARLEPSGDISFITARKSA